MLVFEVVGKTEVYKSRSFLCGVNRGLSSHVPNIAAWKANQSQIKAICPELLNNLHLAGVDSINLQLKMLSFSTVTNSRYIEYYGEHLESQGWCI